MESNYTHTYQHVVQSCMKIAQKRRKLSALPTQTQHKWYKYPPNAFGKRPLRTGYPAPLTKWAWIKNGSVCLYVVSSCKWQTSTFYLPLATLNAMFTTCNMAQRSPLVMQHTGNTWLYAFVSNQKCIFGHLAGCFVMYTHISNSYILWVVILALWVVDMCTNLHYNTI